MYREIYTCHERVTSATPEQLVPLVSDFDAIWPKSLAPPPRPLGNGVYEAPPMIWQEISRAGATRAFRVAAPEELQAEHWFELHPVAGGTLVRHTINGQAHGRYIAIWLEKISPRHDVILEALLDNIEAAVA
jgi:hypothetical protein